MKVLIFTSSAGNGHNSAARTIAQRILEDHPDAEITTIDAYKEYTSKLTNWIISDGYTLACNHLLGLYNYFFTKSEKSDVDNKDKYSAHRRVFPMLQGLMKKIYDYKPDLIISTYVFISVALADLKRTYNFPAKLFALTLDYGISPCWECLTVFDKMFVTGEYMIDRFKQLGFSSPQLVVSGIPVRTQFYKPTNKEEMRDKLGLNKELFTIIVMKSGFFPIQNKILFAELNKVKQQIQIVFVNGKSKQAKENIQKYINKKSFKHVAINLGFVNNVDEYFSACDIVLGKAGGLSTTESITKMIPSIIISKLPKQEMYNRDYLVQNGCALPVNKENSISQNINLLLKDKTKYRQMVRNCEEIRNIKTLDIYAAEINAIEKAKYEIDNFNLLQKQIVKDVKTTLGIYKNKFSIILKRRNKKNKTAKK